MKYLFLLFFIFGLGNSYALIYMQTDKNGNTVYSDTPLNAQATVINPTGNEISSGENAAVNVENTEVEKNAAVASAIGNNDRKPYTIFLIHSPKDQENIWNQPVIPVKVTLYPALQKKDSIQLFLDNKVTDLAAAGTTLSLHNVERGEHQLYAVLLDENQKVLKQSNIITFYFHKISVTPAT